jgi:tetratricopeptide (TPR) repeat protein
LILLFQILTGEARSNYQVDYVLAHTQKREVRRTITDKVLSEDFKAGSLLKSKTLSLAGLEPGDYYAVVSVKNENASQVVSSSTQTFKLGAESSSPKIYFSSNSRQVSNPAVSSYIRGLASVAQNDVPKAIEYLHQAVEKNPANTYAAGMLVNLLFSQRDFDQIITLYQRLGPESLKGAVETAAQVALSYLQKGDSVTAKGVIEKGQTLFPQNPLLQEVSRKIVHSTPGSGT